MKTICFFLPKHFGDNFFAQPFVLNICRNNPDVQFKYWSVIGNFIYDDMINNLTCIEKIHTYNYVGELANGSMPEYQLICDQALMNMFLINSHTSHFTFEYDNVEYIAFNLWGHILGCADVCIHGLKGAFQKGITNINNHYNLNIKYNASDNNLMPILKDVSIDKFLLWKNDNSDKKYVFIYNYLSRSVFNDVDINLFIKHCSFFFPNVIFIVPSFVDELSTLNNVKFCDKDFDCIVDRSCINLVMIEKIQTYCKVIFTFTSGSNWLFINNKLIYSSDIPKIYIINNESYSTKLNEWYNVCRNSNDTVINSIDNINSVFNCIANNT
jgi:hypothetical protein